MPFRDAVIEQTTTVQVGYMAKAQAVTAVSHRDGLFVHVATSLDWVCRALTAKGRSTAPLKGHSQFLDRLLKVTFGGEENTSALADEVDPMEDLQREDDCAGGRQEEAGDALETPQKRSRKQLTKAELEFVTRVRLREVVDNLDLFLGQERERVSQGVLRILLKTNRRRSVYVHEKDLDICMLVMLRHIERMGVPHVDLPDEESALADESEWFDTRTSCWHLRVGDSQEVLVSKPVRRVGADGRPLGTAAVKQRKIEALDAFKAQSKP